MVVLNYLYAPVIPSMGWTVFSDQVPVHTYKKSCNARLHCALANAADRDPVRVKDINKLKLWLIMRKIFEERGIEC